MVIDKKDIDEIVELTIQFYEKEEYDSFDDELLDKLHYKRKKVFGADYHNIGQILSNVVLLKRDYHKPKTLYYRVLELLGYELK